MSLPQPSIQELFNACRILFGPEIHLSVEFIRYLQPSGVKAAYWKRAKEVHPDRAGSLGLKASVLNDQFSTLTSAYETLYAAIGDGADFLPDNTPEPPQARQSQRGFDFRKRPVSVRKEKFDHYYTGRFPARPLLIGQFLYYSRVVSWGMLIAAIQWQRRNRPLIGQIALDWKMLTRADIVRIIRNKRIPEKFGESAVRLGYINNSNLLALLGRQRKIQKPFGFYFVSQGIMCPDDLARYLVRQRLHNRNICH